MSDQDNKSDELLERLAASEAKVLPGMEAALIGITHDGRPVYDETLVIEELMFQNLWDLEESQAWFYHNIAGSVPENGPVFVDIYN
jgi:hypothetical protein